MTGESKRAASLGVESVQQGNKQWWTDHTMSYDWHNEIGAATATGMGEEVIRICGTHTVVEGMRQGLSPQQACRAAVERIVRVRGEKVKELQIAFLAVNKKGEVGAYSLQKGFSYAVKCNLEEKLHFAESWY